MFGVLITLLTWLPSEAGVSNPSLVFTHQSHVTSLRTMAPDKNKKSRRARTPSGIRPRRLTRQRAPRFDRVALHLVIRLLGWRSRDPFSRNSPQRNMIVCRRGGNTMALSSCLHICDYRFVNPPKVSRKRKPLLENNMHSPTTWREPVWRRFPCH